MGWNVPTFGGLQIAPGPLYFNGTNYEIKDNWNCHSYKSAYGKTAGSTYFKFVEMGQLFMKADYTDYYGEYEDIQNLLNPFSGWRLPTSEECNKIIGITSRAGSTVNDEPGIHYAHIELSDITYTMFDHVEVQGLLLFPDNTIIVGATLVGGTDSYGSTTQLTSNELNTYISQGCVFLPAFGGRQNDWHGDFASNNSGYYMSSTTDGGSPYIFNLTFDDASVDSAYISSIDNYFIVRLVK